MFGSVKLVIEQEIFIFLIFFTNILVILTLYSTDFFLIFYSFPIENDIGRYVENVGVLGGKPWESKSDRKINWWKTLTKFFDFKWPMQHWET